MDINAILLDIWNMITFESALKFFILYFFVIWIALIIWVVRDITVRTSNIFLQIFSIFTVLFLTPLGIFIYLLVRPSKTLHDRYYEEIEDNLDIFFDIVEERKREIEERKKLESESDNKKIITEKDDLLPEIINPHN